jgi:hypothetical protein
MSQLYAFHEKAVVLNWELGTKFILWLSCGHSGGTANAREAVARRKCRQCGGLKQIVRVEPVK